MNKKDLEKLGLTAEVIKEAKLPEDLLDKIVVLHGKDIEAHKGKVTTAEEKATTLEGQLAEANKAIEGFKKLDPEGIKKAADEWQAKAEKADAEAKQAAKDADARVAALAKSHALDAALRDAGVRDPKEVIPHLDQETLVLGKDGKFVGLSEQLEPMKESKGYLFSENADPSNPRIITGGNPASGEKATTFAEAISAKLGAKNKE